MDLIMGPQFLPEKGYYTHGLSQKGPEVPNTKLQDYKSLVMLSVTVHLPSPPEKP